jgi:hypothetical protein
MSAPSPEKKAAQFGNLTANDTKLLLLSILAGGEPKVPFEVSDFSSICFLHIFATNSRPVILLFIYQMLWPCDILIFSRPNGLVLFHS